MEHKGLTDEQRAKIEGKTLGEILAIAKNEGFELSEKELEAVAAGGAWGLDFSDAVPLRCANPKCGQSFMPKAGEGVGKQTTCPHCGYTWTPDSILR